MGGTTFENYVDGTDVKDAFHRAREEAGYESGHGGYSGTIVEKGDFTVITPTPMSMIEATALANKLIDEDDNRIADKWGPAGAIPVCTDADATATKMVKVQTGSFTGDWSARDKEIRALVQDKLKLSPDAILKVAIVSDTPAPTRVQAVAPKGQTETRYIITNSQHANWSNGLPSQSEARAKAVELAAQAAQTRYSSSDVFHYEVEAVTRRVGGEPLVQVTSTVPKHSLEVEITYRKANAPRSTRVDGWLFFGWSSC